MTDSNGVRDVHGTFQVPLFLADTTPFSAMVTDADGNPMINGSKTWTANFICVMPVDGARHRTRNPDPLRARPARRRG